MRILNLKFPIILDIFLLLPSQDSHFALFLAANMLERKKIQWEGGKIEFSVHETG